MKKMNKSFESFEKPYKAPSKMPVITASQNHENNVVAIIANPRVINHGKKITLKNKTTKNAIRKMNICLLFQQKYLI